MSAIMGGPIPNSLGAGGASLDFFTHGSVAFTRGVLIITRQQICVNGELVTITQMSARMDAQKALTGGFIDRIPLVGETITIKTQTGSIVTIKQITGIIEECN